MSLPRSSIFSLLLKDISVSLSSLLCMTTEWPRGACVQVRTASTSQSYLSGYKFTAGFGNKWTETSTTELKHKVMIDKSEKAKQSADLGSEKVL